MYNTIPQQKLVEVNRDLGNPAITQQQATCRTIYDTIDPPDRDWETDKKGDELRKGHRDKRYDPPLPN